MQQKRLDLHKQQELLWNELELEIQAINSVGEKNDNSKKRKREVILDELNFDEFEEQFTENSSDNGEDNDTTLEDAEDFNNLVDDFIFDEGISKFIFPKTKYFFNKI